MSAGEPGEGVVEPRVKLRPVETRRLPVDDRLLLGQKFCGQTVRNEKCCAFPTVVKVCGALSAALTASTVFGSTPSPPICEPHSCTGIAMSVRASAVKKTDSGSAITAALIRRSCVNGSLGYACALILIADLVRPPLAQRQGEREVGIGADGDERRIAAPRESIDANSIWIDRRCPRRGAGQVVDHALHVQGTLNVPTTRRTGFCRAPYRRDG